MQSNFVWVFGRIAYTKNKAAVREAAEKRGLQSSGAFEKRRKSSVKGSESVERSGYTVQYLQSLGLPVEGVPRRGGCRRVFPMR